jgi:hypothetical protein
MCSGQIKQQSLNSGLTLLSQDLSYALRVFVRYPDPMAQTKTNWALVTFCEPFPSPKHISLTQINGKISCHVGDVTIFYFGVVHCRPFPAAPSDGLPASIPPDM